MPLRDGWTLERDLLAAQARVFYEVSNHRTAPATDRNVGKRSPSSAATCIGSLQWLLADVKRPHIDGLLTMNEIPGGRIISRIAKSQS